MDGEVFAAARETRLMTEPGMHRASSEYMVEGEKFAAFD